MELGPKTRALLERLGDLAELLADHGRDRPLATVEQAVWEIRTGRMRGLDRVRSLLHPKGPLRDGLCIDLRQRGDGRLDALLARIEALMDAVSADAEFVDPPPGPGST